MARGAAQMHDGLRVALDACHCGVPRGAAQMLECAPRVGAARADSQTLRHAHRYAALPRATALEPL
jgi:hypothetical protein